MNPYKPEKIRFEMTGEQPFYERTVLAPVIEALCANASFVPEEMGLGEHSGRPFDIAEALLNAGGKSSQHMLRLERKSRLNHTTLVRLNNMPGLIVELSKATPAADWRQLFDLADSLAEAYRPDIAWVHLYSSVEPPVDSDEDKTQALMDAVVVGSGINYMDDGPGGLGLRTYVGPRLVDLIGRDLLLSTPVSLTELSWGGVRLDLVAEPWQATQSELHAAWLGATAHLRPAGVFSEAVIDEDGYPYVERGGRFQLGARR